jgi:hypothetical protein
MAHADDATKAWVSAIPKKNADGNVMEWRCRYSYTLNAFSHTFEKRRKLNHRQRHPQLTRRLNC